VLTQMLRADSAETVAALNAGVAAASTPTGGLPTQRPRGPSRQPRGASRAEDGERGARGPTAAVKTPLRTAIDCGHVRIVQLYLAHGARSADASDVARALERGMHGAARMLLNAGFPENSGKLGSLSGSGNGSLLSVVFVESAHFNVHNARALFAAGARLRKMPELLSNICRVRATQAWLPRALRTALEAVHAEVMSEDAGLSVLPVAGSPCTVGAV